MPRPLTTLTAATALVGAAGVAYGGLVERRAYTLRRFTVPLLATGAAPIRVLHVSDIHLLPGQRDKIDWVRRLARLDPHLVVDTGDNLSDPDGVGAAVHMLGPLLAFPGVLVAGSNDYFAPRPKNPARYLLPDVGTRKIGVPMPYDDLKAALEAGGWHYLGNRRICLALTDGRRVEVVGVDDPHIARDRYDLVAGPADPGADLRLGVTHSPEPRVLDAMAADGFELILAGHTHGGQLCVPCYGALVTNCGLDRGRVKGLSRWREGPDAAWLHVSAGLGTSPYAPVRFACRPEATLLTLVPAR